MDVTGKNLAPIVLFVYNRPWHTHQTLKALAKNELADQSTLYIFCDGPKPNSTEKELQNIAQTREIIKNKLWCNKINIIESKYNKGLANSIVTGVTEIINKYGKIIVLEDDIRAEKGFLTYMNQMLNIYADNNKVMQINGYMYPTKSKIKESSLSLKVMACWGWATWDRAWKYYNDNSKELRKNLEKSAKQINKFNIEGHAHFYEQLLLNSKGELKTWAVKWYASWLFHGGTSIFPSKSLVKNIGHDGSGENCNSNNIYNTEITNTLKAERVRISENKTVRHEVDVFFKENFNIKPKQKSTLIAKFKNLARRLFRQALITAIPDIGKILKDHQSDYPFYHRNIIYESSIDKKTKLYAPYKIHNSVIDKYTYIAPNSTLNYTTIGKFCSIGPNLICGWGIHPTEGISTSPMFYSTQKQNGFSLTENNKIQETKPIMIGNDVFIGMNVTILDGVKIGNGAIIGAGAIVSKDIPDYAIAVGNPIRIIKYRFPKTTIDKLLHIKWWDFPENKLDEVEMYFMNVDEFIKDKLDAL
jgi:acetyltransferase-like isoleucine patch superfamily enzyme